MSESKYREWILDTIDSLRSRKARPDLERICRMVRRRHGSEPERTCAELEKLIQEQTVLKVNYKGSISYRNAAKVQRRSRKNNRDDNNVTSGSGGRRSGSLLEEGASHSDLSNGDSALGPADQDETEDLEADGSMAMDTDSNAEEEGADERSRDGPGGRPPGHTTYEDSAVKCAPVHAFSAPCSPSGSRPGPSSSVSPSPGAGLDCVVSAWKAIGRPSSLPPSSPRALIHNDWAYDSAFCPAERQHPGMQKDKGAELSGAVKSAGQPVATSPCIPKNTTPCIPKNTSPCIPKNISPCTPKNISPCTPKDISPCTPKDISPCTPKDTVKKEEGWRTDDRGPSYDQMVPDNGTKLDETKSVCDGSPQTLPLTSDNCVKSKKKLDLDSLIPAEDVFLNGGKNGDVSVKKENMNQNLLQWSVADVASYFSAAGFPEQALAFRTQEIDGKSLLLMQRSDVLTGLSIRLGPALKIYERHVKVLQRTHFLEDEDL